MKEKELLELIAAQVDKLTEDMAEVKSEVVSVKNIVVKIENDHGRKLGALFDGYELTYEKLTALEEKADTIDKKVDTQDVEIRVIKGSKELS